MVAQDTRPSGPGLAQAAAAGVQSLGVTAEMVGLLTTPQLHWMVRGRNAGRAWDEQAYLQELAGAFKQVVAGTQPLGQVRQLRMQVVCYSRLDMRNRVGEGTTGCAG